MKKLFALLLVSAAYVGGYGYGRWYAKPSASQPGEKKILYWVDAMHPWYKSDKPGIAPDCGMKLQPVYQGDPQPEANRSNTPAGAIQITPKKQRLTGVK